MASNSSNKRSQGGGRTANTEPRLQVFKEFAGCNFQESPRDFTLGIDIDQMEQSDLQMNYVVIQNNAAIASDKTIATRNNLRTLFSAKSGESFTDAAILINNELYIANEAGGLCSLELGTGFRIDVAMNDYGQGYSHHWEDFAYADGKIIGATTENKLWYGEFGSYKMNSPIYVDKPTRLKFDDLYPQGELKVNPTYDEDEYPFRIAIAYTSVTEFGPTELSDELVFYASLPVSEWNSFDYLKIIANIPASIAVTAVELYYTVDNSSTFLFMGRVDKDEYWEGSFKWVYHWFGYLDTTYSWANANLIAPTDNYTEGPPVSRLTCIDSRMYFWGGTVEEDNIPYRLYIGGNSGNLLSISPGTGGGFVDVEPDTGQEIRWVGKYKTQSGASIVTMLTDSQNSHREQRFNLVENQVSLSNEQNMKSWQAEQVAGAAGCKSYDGAIVCEDGLYSVSRYGLALTTMTMEYNSQIRTNYVSDPIKPVFVDVVEGLLSDACLLEIDGILYVSFGYYPYGEQRGLDRILFCYDIDAKAWWTYSLDEIPESEPIIKLIHIDYENYQQGVGIITPKHVYLLPTTQDDDVSTMPTYDCLIETGELSAQKPTQGWLHLTQLEFRFDHFIGDIQIDVVCIDQFGRQITTTKKIRHDEVKYNLSEYMRIDLKVQDYKIIMHGCCNFRMTHFIAKVYTMSARQGIVWGFDDSQSYRTFGDIHPTFKNYNDIRLAIVP